MIGSNDTFLDYKVQQIYNCLACGWAQVKETKYESLIDNLKYMTSPLKKIELFESQILLHVEYTKSFFEKKRISLKDLFAFKVSESNLYCASSCLTIQLKRLNFDNHITYLEFRPL